MKTAESLLSEFIKTRIKVLHLGNDRYAGRYFNGVVVSKKTYGRCA